MVRGRWSEKRRVLELYGNVRCAHKGCTQSSSNGLRIIDSRILRINLKVRIVACIRDGRTRGRRGDSRVTSRCCVGGKSYQEKHECLAFNASGYHVEVACICAPGWLSNQAARKGHSEGGREGTMTLKAAFVYVQRRSAIAESNPKCLSARRQS